tara:strand:+ start:390 stop:728 length:339 start_codon:yes stop_codon:yes gene_type:complete
MDQRRIKITSKEQFKQCIDQLPYFVLKFTASWCGPCKRVQPLVDELFSQLPDDFYYVEVDIDEGKNIANALRIRSVPTMMNYKNGMGEFMITGGDEVKVRNFFSRIIKSYGS